ncbi:cation:proton antiporter [Iamia sp.]|uniref:cation:proton antiporter domain-containing protein n=1 Tax=Iamia sp. TaxID=2722710 RepID=UPI002BB50C8E|nr:cation:proton antiporter [Iamia sp.]HXH59104.1 cation:proton antiporter [Iamia sp.]
MIHADRILVLTGLALVLLGLSSRAVKRYALSPVLLALGAGVLVGPHVLDLIEPESVVPRVKLLEQLSRVALALSVFDIALRTKPSDLRANRGRIAVLLLVLMPAMWLVTALGASLLLGLPLALALLLGATLTPTDPGVASALVAGVLPNRLLPRRVRMSLQVEAGANDGLALPFVLFAGLLATAPNGQVLNRWAVEAGRELGTAVVVGALVGLLLLWLTDLAGIERLAEEDWFPLASTGVSLTVLGAAHILGGTGIFAVFIAGLIFSEGLPEDLRQPIHTVHRSVTKVALTVVFLAFGTVLPVDAWWPSLGGAGVAFAVWALVMRRLPVGLPALLLTSTGPVSSAFIGWSGPLGAAAIYYLAFIERYDVAGGERLFLAGSLAVTVSVLGHALTSALAVRAYGRVTGTEVEEGERAEVDGPLP